MDRDSLSAAVVVLFGGDGSEHRVSVASAQHLAKVLPEASFWYWTLPGEVLVVPRSRLVDFERPFESDFEPVALGSFDGTPRRFATVDDALDDDEVQGATFVLAVHGGSGENGWIQSRLESRDHAFTGSGAAASRLAFDKSLARETLAAQGVRVAEAVRIEGEDSKVRAHDLWSRNPAGIVLKPVADGSSHGVRIATSVEQLDAALAGVQASPECPFLAEAFITGRELTVGVVDGASGPRALPCSEVRLDPGRSFDYDGKYLGRGAVELTPAPVAESTAGKAQEAATTAHRALGCRGYSRTDLIVDDNGPVFLETNTLPGLTERSFIPQQLEAAGISMRSFLEGQLARARSRS